MGRGYFREIRVDGKVLLKFMVKKYGVWVWTGYISFRVAINREDRSSSVKGGTILE
jgi:hypothetical protein